MDDQFGSFESVFKADAAVRAEAPGRVNLMGEHTDYHQGFVLPTVLPLRTVVELRMRADRTVRTFSSTMPDGVRRYQCGNEMREGEWLDYVKGITSVLARTGIDIPGFDAFISSTVPIGAGVSSSAALEIALLRALRAAATLAISDREMAILAQRAEVEFVGAPVGIMDQMVCSLGRDGQALFLDTRTLDCEHVPLPSQAQLAVVDSGIAHANARGGYVERRRESFEAAAALGVNWLRDVPQSGLDALRSLPEILAGRARHVVTENVRVLNALDALRHDDAARLGQLFTESHISMRNDYEASTPEIDELVRTACLDEDVYGARLTGGGFGGAVVLLTRAGCAAAAAARVLQTYRERTRRPGLVLLPVAA